jgi:hypothetical protein
VKCGSKIATVVVDDGDGLGGVYDGALSLQDFFILQLIYF